MLVVYLGLQNCRQLRLVLIPFSLIPTASLKTDFARQRGVVEESVPCGCSLC